MTEPILRASSVVATVLRLFAIFWLAKGAIAFGGSAGLWGYGMPRSLLAEVTVFMEPTAYVTLAILTWIFADRIAVKVAGQEDPELPDISSGLGDMYRFGLLLMGLYFFLNHLGGTLVGLLWLAMNEQPVLRNQLMGSPIHQLTANLIACLTGLVMALRSPLLGRKLAARTREDPQESRG